MQNFLQPSTPAIASSASLLVGLCDKDGPLNIVMAINAVSMLATWSVPNTLTPLVILATVNGVANGAYLKTQPTVVAGIFGHGRTTVVMSMPVTAWSAGYLMGEVAAEESTGVGQSIEVCGPAVHAGGMAILSASFIILAKLTTVKVLNRVQRFVRCNQVSNSVVDYNWSDGSDRMM